jgi:O-antigen ligase
MFIATGIPGGVLWLALLFTLLKLSLDAFRHTHSFYALAPFFVVLDFSLRMTLDGIVRDHVFQQFMLFVGLLAGFTGFEATRSRSTP